MFSLHQIPLDNVHVVMGACIVARLRERAPKVAPQLVIFGEHRRHKLSAKVKRRMFNQIYLNIYIFLLVNLLVHSEQLAQHLAVLDVCIAVHIENVVAVLLLCFVTVKEYCRINQPIIQVNYIFIDMKQE